MDLNKLRKLAGLPQKEQAPEVLVEETAKEDKLEESMFSMSDDFSGLVDPKDFNFPKGPTTGSKVFLVSAYNPEDGELFLEVYATAEKAQERYDQLDQALGETHHYVMEVSERHVG